MSTVAVPKALESLVDFLTSQEQRVPMEGLRQHLTELTVTAEDLKLFSHFGDTCYSRNLVCEGKWFELLCICWKNGQESLIHNHAQSTCGLRVIQGVATETTFEELECGKVTAVKQCTLQNGGVCCTQDADIHQVSNFQSDGTDLMTLHIYSPPLREMQTWERQSDD